MKKPQLLVWLLRLIGPLKGQMVVAISLGIISNLAVVAIPVIGFQQLTQVLQGHAIQTTRLLWLLVGLGILRALARYGEQYCNHNIAFRLLALLRQKIFRHLRLLGPARLTGLKSGDFITTITSDIEALEVFFAHTVSPFFIFLGTTLATVGFVATHSWLLALLLLLGLLVVGLVLPIWSYQRYEHVATEHHETFVDLNQQVVETIDSLGMIEQYDLGTAQTKNLAEKGHELNRTYREKLTQSTGLQIISEATMITTAVLVFVAGWLAHLPVTTIGVSVILTLSAFGPAFSLSGLGSALLTTFASGYRIFDLLHEEPAVTFPVAEHAEPEPFEEAALQNIAFAHDETAESLFDGISLTLTKGQTLGISGPSGIGKSTLIKLLMRYWDPQKGNVTLNHESLRRFSEKELHHYEGFFEQSTFLFEGTIAENIGLGKAGASLEEIQAAAQKAAIHEWILALPDAYQTEIGQASRHVSDGERQRLGLARLFLQDAPLLLLDEPTSNLDYLNEILILDSLKKVQDKAVLLVSHRDTTLSTADQVYQLKNRQLSQK